jgi:hypothetical protein
VYIQGDRGRRRMWPMYRKSFKWGMKWGSEVWYYLIGRNYVFTNTEVKTDLELMLSCHQTLHRDQT